MKKSRKCRRIEAARVRNAKHAGTSTNVNGDAMNVAESLNNINVSTTEPEDGMIDVEAAIERGRYLEQLMQGDVDRPSMFVGKTANEWITEAAARPNPKSLWLSLWYEGEMCCLFADTNVGKSIYAVQIAGEIARKQRVLYFDFEMTDKQFQLRYTDEDTGTVHNFGPNLVRIEFNAERRAATNLRGVIADIAREALNRQAKVLIIDNISWICNCAESADVAGELMTLLIELKRNLGLSILVLAHTPKRIPGMPLTQNCLAGSKRLANFMDSMFAIGIDHSSNPAGRYIKQIKVRSSEMEYDADNVITAELEKQGSFIRLRHTGYGVESKMLGSDAVSEEKAARFNKIADMLDKGFTVRDICTRLKVSPKTVVKVNKATSA